MSIKGALRDVDLASMIETLCARGGRVAVALERTGEEGTLFLENGQIVHAELGPMEGESAVYHLMSWTDGSFRVISEVRPPRRTVRLGWQNLVLEGARQLDETRHQLGSGEPLLPAGGELTWQQVEADQDLETRLVQLLSRLDQLAAKLAEPRGQQPAEEGLRLLAEIVNAVVASGPPLGGATPPFDVEAAFERLTAGHRHQLRCAHGRLAVAGEGASGAFERRQLFGESRRVLVALLHAGLDHLGSGFHSPQSRAEWQESYTVFVRDVVRNAESLRP